MQYKFLVIILFFYFLTLFQNSFVSHFAIFGIFPNLVLVLFCLFVFFEDSHKHSNIFLVFTAGFFLDIFSNSFFGVSVFSFIVIYFFIKETIHLLRDIPREYSIIYFILIFIFSIILYDFFFGLFSRFLSRSLISPFDGYALIIEIIYNLPFAVAGFYLFNPPKFLLRKNLGR